MDAPKTLTMPEVAAVIVTLRERVDELERECAELLRQNEELRYGLTAIRGHALDKEVDVLGEGLLPTQWILGMVNRALEDAGPATSAKS